MTVYSRAIELLKQHHVRPTRQRKMLARMLFEQDPHHFTAEELCQRVRHLRMGISRATVYNTLNQFSRAGLLREIIASSGHTFYDTNMAPHHHFYHEESGLLEDIPGDQVGISHLPDAPSGRRIKNIDVVIRLSHSKDAEMVPDKVDMGREDLGAARL